MRLTPLPSFKIWGSPTATRSWHISLSLVYLSAWIIVSVNIWHYHIFSKTNVGLVIAVHILLDLSLAPWAFFVAARRPPPAAVVSTFIAIVSANLALVFTLVFPPRCCIFAIRQCVDGKPSYSEGRGKPPDTDTGLTLLPILIVAIIDIFLWPWLGALWESRLYWARNPKLGLYRLSARLRGKKKEEALPHPEGVAISIRNFSKAFPASVFKRDK
ncbi:hypothetical protein CONPUDRAFT_159669 [Coniophora puteana RWD-64-598 SS2]|uniref:Uncharacterized protein n=1 Tax=Coniophora puteana (strain RWD-64-598) TaxID=741705 RepID=A0A5M3M7X7_CONPW|nr:uncharacterized protein CONPUDRAFT_159669 [Coniophora puteana RWD-64-598 SS2]EIW74895.1 hypothetical protein CONPUDRAFT_159669 [Coniophora puteana RWD-64-598 SS2]